MLEFARFEGRKRIRASVALAAGLSALTALYVWLFPTVSEGIDLDEYAESLPPAVVAAFDLRALGTIEGFLAAELYGAMWVLLLGLYLAYAAASLLAADVESRRLEITLSLPVSRARVVVERYLALLVPIGVLNAVVPVVVFVATVLIDDRVPVPDLLAVHALSVPYLLACAGLGLFASTLVDRAGIAQRVALAVLFGLFLIDSVVATTDYAPLGALAPMRYYDPSAILVDGEYDLAGAAILLAMAASLVGAAAVAFSRRDL